MFDSKKKSLFTTPTTTSGEQSTMVTTNPFLLSALKNTSRTNEGGNGALKYTTSGSDFVDQFAKVTEYRQPRNYSEISEDMSLGRIAPADSRCPARYNPTKAAFLYNALSAQSPVRRHSGPRP